MEEEKRKKAEKEAEGKAKQKLQEKNTMYLLAILLSIKISRNLYAAALKVKRFVVGSHQEIYQTERGWLHQ